MFTVLLNTETARSSKRFVFFCFYVMLRRYFKSVLTKKTTVTVCLDPWLSWVNHVHSSPLGGSAALTLSQLRAAQTRQLSGNKNCTCGKGNMEAAVFILSLVDCCALIFLSVYFVSFSIQWGRRYSSASKRFSVRELCWSLLCIKKLI